MPAAIIRPPGPKGRRFVRSPLLGGAGPLVNLPRMARQYGDISFWRFLHISSYFFANPSEVESVLVTHHRDFIKGIGTRANPEVFGNGLLTSEGDFWLRQRRLEPTRVSSRAHRFVRRNHGPRGRTNAGWLA